MQALEQQLKNQNSCKKKLTGWVTTFQKKEWNQICENWINCSYWNTEENQRNLIVPRIRTIYRKFYSKINVQNNNRYKKNSERSNTKWILTEKEQTAFDQNNNETKTIDYLSPYNTNMKTILSVEASTIGLGATLWQVNDNGEWRPIV